jgi:cysteinyl-tRNA synthetase
MAKELFIYNTLTRTKERFEPLNPPHVGLYVCGPTVYGDPHLGHARPAVTFDILFRYLKHLGYKVRYVRNITDVGHLEDEMAGAGEDRIQKRARIEQLEPMEVVQYYTNRYHTFMDKLNVLPPSIEPHASGHIIEQQQLIRSILDRGFAYEINGSVYFDLRKYNDKYGYGILSGRKLDIMHWPSEWSEGFPGWHLECSAMGMKYLGEQFDIHGGGMDLIFPHHECELAQSTAVTGKSHVRYWMHNNMITINGQKMSKSKNNFITLEEMFNGSNALLEKAYSPMTIRFYMLQAHYSSPIDFSNEALKAAEQGLNRLMKGLSLLPKLNASASSTADVMTLQENAYTALGDDLNCPILLGNLFEGVRIINSVKDGKEKFNANDLDLLKTFMHTFTFDLLGLMQEENQNQGEGQLLDKVVKLLLQQRQEAKIRKDYATSDDIRNQLIALGIVLKDTKNGTEWERE